MLFWFHTPTIFTKIFYTPTYFQKMVSYPNKISSAPVCNILNDCSLGGGRGYNTPTQVLSVLKSAGKIGLILLIPSYFRPTLYTNGGKVLFGSATISPTLSCTSIKFFNRLEIPFKVSENNRLVKKSFVWLS